LWLFFPVYPGWVLISLSQKIVNLLFE